MKKLLSIAIAFAMVTSLSAPAFAVNADWVGGADSDWTTAARWSGGAVPDNIATFNAAAGAGGAVINLGAGHAVTIGSITFDQAACVAYTIGAAPVGTDVITLNNGGGITVNNNVAATQTIQANVALSPNGTFANNGANGDGFLLQVTGTVTGGAANGTLVLNGSDTDNNLISGNILKGAATLGVTKGSAVTEIGKWILSGTNTYTGLTTVNYGALNIQNASALGTVDAGASVTSGAALEIQGGIAVGSEALTLNGTGVAVAGALRNISGDNSWAGAITLGSATRINSDLNTLTLGAGGITGAGQNLTVGGVGNTVITGVISTTTGTLTKDGGGALTLSGGNGYSGGTTLTLGTLNINNETALGTGAFVITTGTIDNTSAADITLTTGGAQTWNGNFAYTGGTRSLNLGTGPVTLGATPTITVNGNTLTVGGVVSGGQGITKAGAGTLVLSGANAYTGATTVNAGTLKIAADSGLGTAPGVATPGQLTFGGGTLQTTANMTLDSNRGIALTGAGTLSTDASTTLTYGGIIAGAGGVLTKAGTGTLTLSGVNTYTGGTTLTAGTLNINSTTALGGLAGTFTINGGTIDNTSAGAITLANNKVQTWGSSFTFTGTKDLNLAAGAVALGAATKTVTTTAGTLTVGGVISSTGAYGITKAGSGTLTLSGANDFSGQLTVEAGTLAIATINNVSAAGTLGNSALAVILGKAGGSTGTLQYTAAAGATASSKPFTMAAGGTGAFQIDTAGQTLTLSGVIDGGGGLTKTGDGTLTLSGTNTYTGVTTVNAGTLNAGKITAAFGAGSAVTVATGATLGLNNFDETIGSLAGSGTVTNGGAADHVLTAGGDGTSTTFSGIIQDGGGLGKTGLTKAGAGTLTLSGANTYTGDTTINANSTVVANNANALGNGSAVTNNGTLNIGSTNLNVGAYAQGAASTLMVAVNGTTHGSIVGTGAAGTTAGYTVALSVSNYVPNNATYTIIDGTGAGTIGTPVITITGDNRATFSATTIGNDLILTASRTANGFASDATSGNSNASAVGTVLDTITNQSAEMTTVLNTMESLSNAQVASALDTMVPEVDAGVLNTSTTALNNFVGVSMDRVEQTLKLAKAADSAATGVSAGEASKLSGAWGKGYGSYLTQGTRNGIAGYDAWNAGTALGVDHLFADCVTLGVSGGYAYGNVDSDVNNASTYINSAQATIYGGYEDKNLPFFIDAAGSFAWNWYQGQRDINVGNVILSTANADYDGQQYGAYIGGGYRFDVTKNIEFTPLLSLQYNHLQLHSYTETEAGALNLSVASQGYDQLQSGLGARIASPIKCKWGTFTPEAHGKWFYDFIGDSMVVSSSFNGGGASFDSNGAKPALNSFNAGGQLIFEFKNDVSLIANCDTEMKDEFFGIYGSATVRYEF